MKTRFCPSPTGYMHIGNARTALFCALLAKNQQGKFLLRIEDTDRERSKTIYTEQLYADLRWLGLLWQEGPIVGGDAGPYLQSERQNIYDQSYHELEKSNLAYACFCKRLILGGTSFFAGRPPCKHRAEAGSGCLG